jgi:hypothetical protein
VKTHTLLKWGLSVAILAFGCQPTPESKHFKQSVRVARESCDASTVRDAVLPLFVRFTPDAEIPGSEIPSTVASLPFFQKATNAIEVLWTGESSPALMFITGGGFGHHGVVVCSDENDPDVPRLLGDKLILWDRGIYVYRD